MHRSGTSLIARMVNVLGVELGPEKHLLVAKDDNPKGFWEYVPFIHVNRRILDRHGGTWDSPPELSGGWSDSYRLLDQRILVRLLLLRDFRGRAWGWKDPRSCLTLPFWKGMFPNLKAIVCFRNPLDVARSLERRNGMPLAEGLALWHRYTASALENTEDTPRVVLSYEESMRDPQRTFATIAELLLPADGDGRPALQAELPPEIVDPNLRHNASSTASVIEGPGVPEEVRTLYTRLISMTDAR